MRSTTEKRLKEQISEVKCIRKTLRNVLQTNPSTTFIMYQINKIQHLRAMFLNNHQKIMSVLSTKQTKYAMKKKVYLFEMGSQATIEFEYILNHYHRALNQRCQPSQTIIMEKYVEPTICDPVCVNIHQVRNENVQQIQNNSGEVKIPNDNNKNETQTNEFESQEQTILFEPNTASNNDFEVESEEEFRGFDINEIELDYFI